MAGFIRIHVRIFNNKNDKRTWKPYRVDEFPLSESLKDVRDCFFENYQNEMTHCKSSEDLEVGYIGNSNSKHVIKDDATLRKAFESGKAHKDGLPVFFVAKASYKRPEKNHVQESTSESDEATEPKKKRKKKPKKSQDERISELVDRLVDAHGDKWCRGDYRLWATALDQGFHRSYDNPPDYPHFRRQRISRTKTDAPVSSSTTSSSSPSPSTSTSTKPKRTELLENLKTLQELQRGGILTQEEVDEQKDAILKELKSL